MSVNSPPAGAPEQACANCGRRLDPTDKFCRECGLPTMRQAQAQTQVPAMPPDTGELKRAVAAASEPRPFVRSEPLPEPEPDEADTTGSVVRATNPTFAAQLASSTLLMVAVIILLAAAGIVFLFLAFKP